MIAHSSGDDASVFDNGLPLTATDWIRDGELEHLITTRHSAGLTGLPVAPAIGNLILDGGGERSLEEMVAAHRARAAADLPLVHPRGRPGDAAADRADPGRRLPRGERRGRRRGQQLPVQRVAGGPAVGRATEAGRTEKTLPREWSDWFTRAAMPALRVPDFNMSSVSQGV